MMSKPESGQSSSSSSLLSSTTSTVYRLRSRQIVYSVVPKLKPRQRSVFTELERRKIVEYLLKTGGYEGIRGTALWKRMSVKFPNHTWQSLKEHLIKKILPNLGSVCRSAGELEQLRQGLQITSNCVPHIVNQYSQCEDNIILNYVSAHGKDAKLGGNLFWREMESKQILPARTWHSLRERYLKYLRRNIVGSNFVSGSTTNFATQKNRKASQDSDSREEQRPEELDAHIKPRKKRRLLFTLTDTFESQNSNFHEDPVSEVNRGPSMLAVLKRNQDLEASARRRHVRALMKSQVYMLG